MVGFRGLDGQVAELLADAVIEARAWELSELSDHVDEADIQGSVGDESACLGTVDRDVYRRTPGRIADGEHVLGGDDEGASGEGVGSDVADHVALHAPGEDRALVGKVVAGRAGRG